MELLPCACTGRCHCTSHVCGCQRLWRREWDIRGICPVIAFFSPDGIVSCLRPIRFFGGESGIRTHGTLPYDGFRNRCLRPLGHLSMRVRGVGRLMLSARGVFVLWAFRPLGCRYRFTPCGRRTLNMSLASVCAFADGGDNGTRTRDLLVANETFSQLNYTPVGDACFSVGRY